MKDNCERCQKEIENRIFCEECYDYIYHTDKGYNEYFGKQSKKRFTDPGHEIKETRVYDYKYPDRYYGWYE